LPKDVDHRPKGMPRLASSKKFINVKCPECGGKAGRDPETLDTFVDSSWYYLRYTDPKNKKKFADAKKLAYWMPTNLYVIGAEHTVLHLLYSRFITKFLYDEGLIKTKEPFMKLRHVGLILGPDGQKMSKSRGNVINPDELVKQFGADTVRLYEMFMGPFEDGQPWETKSLIGVHRFLNRFWNYMHGAIADSSFKKQATDGSVRQLIHRTIKKVTEDIEQMRFNTAISAMMILLNTLSDGARMPKVSLADMQSIVKLLYPFVPHISQELWSRLGKKTLLDKEPWPSFDPALIKEEKFKLVIQINGKVRDSVEVEAGISEKDALALALGREKIVAVTNGAPPKKVVFVPGRLISIVT
jgi:leucyl-tRNA synthetase